MQVAANPAPGSHFAGWTGEVSGSEPRQAVVMDAAKSLAAVFARSEPLRPGRNEGRDAANLPSVPALTAAGTAMSVLVPPDAAELTVRFRLSSAAEADLYVRRGSEVRSEPVRTLARRLASMPPSSRSPGVPARRSRPSGNRLHAWRATPTASASPFRAGSGGFGERCGWRSGAAGSSRRGPRLSRACPPPGQTQDRRPSG